MNKGDVSREEWVAEYSTVFFIKKIVVEREYIERYRLVIIAGME
jgi:hypothetical protein